MGPSVDSIPSNIYTLGIVPGNDVNMGCSENIDSEKKALYAVEKFDALYNKVYQVNVAPSPKESRRLSSGLRFYSSEDLSGLGEVDPSTLTMDRASEQLQQSLPLAEKGLDFLNTALVPQISDGEVRKAQIEKDIAALTDTIKKIAATKLFSDPTIQTRFESLVSVAMAMGGVTLAIGVCICFTQSGHAVVVMAGSLIGMGIAPGKEGSYKESLQALQEKHKTLEAQLFEVNSDLMRAKGMKSRLDCIAEKLNNLKLGRNTSSSTSKSSTSPTTKRSSWLSSVTFEGLPSPPPIVPNKAAVASSNTEEPSSPSRGAALRRRSSMVMPSLLGIISDEPESFETNTPKSEESRIDIPLAGKQKNTDETPKIFKKYNLEKDKRLSLLESMDLGSFFDGSELDAQNPVAPPLVIDTQKPFNESVEAAAEPWYTDLDDSLKELDQVIQDSKVGQENNKRLSRESSQIFHHKNLILQSEKISENPVADFSSSSWSDPEIDHSEAISISEKNIEIQFNAIDSIKNEINVSIRGAEELIKQQLQGINGEVANFNGKYANFSEDVKKNATTIDHQYLKEMGEWILSEYAIVNAKIDESLGFIFEFYALLQESIKEAYSQYVDFKEKDLIKFSNRWEVSSQSWLTFSKIWEKNTLPYVQLMCQVASPENTVDTIKKLYDACLENTQFKLQDFDENKFSRFANSLMMDAADYADAVKTQLNIDYIVPHRVRQETTDSGFAGSWAEDESNIRKFA